MKIFEYLPIVLIVGGYLALIWQAGWIGIVAAVVHAGVLLAGTVRRSKKTLGEKLREAVE
jgi:CHASE2 domain-containing sensor protein